MTTGRPRTVCRIASMAEALACPATVRIFAAEAGFDDLECERIGIAVSELATNIVRHAQTGTITAEVHAKPAGIEVVAADDGPGIEDIDAALGDGYSQGRLLAGVTSPGPREGLGSGLGAVSRFMDEVSVESSPEQGTRIRAFKLLRRPQQRSVVPEKPSTLILGLGNSILTDDGIGVHVVRKIAEGPVLPGIDLKEAEVAGFNLLDLLEGYSRAIVVDAIRVPDRQPGDVIVIGLEQLTPSLHLVAGHQIDLPTALELGRRLERDVPQEVHIVGVQIVDDRTFGEWPTPKVSRAIPAAARVALKLATEGR